MVRLRALFVGFVLVAMATPSSAQAPTATDSEFLVSVTEADGATHVRPSNIVPLIPDSACFEWRVRLAQGDRLVSVTEVFALPAEPRQWGGIDGNEYSLSKLSGDRRVSETTMFYKPQDGWISHGWCMAEGDPIGPYSIKVLVGDRLVHKFDFSVENAPASSKP
ncbi:hypothetical protein X770_25235 [Mesorhizobium sp. LSJC269B00]|nr:hypothetical protein X770_25235 [Mesorhizobium sp. LSJC269B00]